MKFELSAQGELVIVTPVSGEGGSREAELIGDLVFWNRSTQLGKVFSCSTCFKLPNGADRPRQVLQNPKQVDGEEVLPGFVFDLPILWE